jgi:4'-phosphopantetheinyl transferase
MSARVISWLPRPAEPAMAFGPREVHVWRARGPAAAGLLPSGCLDQAERQRAMRLIFPAARVAFTFAHAMLRTVASAYLGVDPADLRFATGANGKPSLPNETLRFNLSHSGDAVLLACAEGQEVGIDLEATGRLCDDETLARVSLSEAERRLVETKSKAAVRRMVLQMWTRKEALLKADGSGLTSDPRALTLHAPAIGSGPMQVEHAGRAWTLMDLPLGAAWQATLAAEGSAPDVRLYCLGWDKRRAGRPT